MSSEQLFRICIKNLETRIAIGIHAHEYKPQRVLVNAEIYVTYEHVPQSIAECLNYDHIHALVTKDWPARQHVYLLETCVSDLMGHIFRLDERITRVRASVVKPDIFADAESVGVEADWTRQEYERTLLPG